MMKNRMDSKKVGPIWIVFILKQVTEKRLSHNLESRVGFTDLKKNYDSVPLARIWKTIRNQGKSGRYITMTKQLYIDITVCTKMGK